MEPFIKGLGSVLLAVVIVLAWPWTNLLKDVGFIDDSGRIFILLLVTAIFVCQQTYLALPNPVDYSVIEARRKLTELYLCDFMRQYYDWTYPGSVDTF